MEESELLKTYIRLKLVFQLLMSTAIDSKLVKRTDFSHKVCI